MPERAGYTLVVYCLDVSPSMGDALPDPATGQKKAKLDLAKELIARKCEPKIASGRKTEAVGVLSFGGKTNNQANNAFVKDNPDTEDPPYAAVSCDVAIQTAKPKTVEEVMNLQLGEEEGNPVSAVMVALDMIQTHKHTKSWALEVMLVTDGESAFRQDEYEDAMQRLDDLGVKLSVIGLEFTHPDDAVPKTKTRNKRLSEKFWRVFIQTLHERLSPHTSSEEILPFLGTFNEALIAARMPKPAVVNGTLSGIDLRIGSPDVDPAQAISIPIKYSKATMKARPPTLSKAWKPAMDLQAHPGTKASAASASAQLASNVAQQAQSLDVPPKESDLAAMISAQVNHYSTYVIKRQEPAPPDSTQAIYDASQKENSQQVPQDVGEEEEEPVAKEDIVKAWRFGSTWVPMEKDTFEPLDTQKGVEILGFFPREAVKRHLLMGEVRFVWPDLTSPKAQIQFSSLVEGMALREMVAIVRWVLKDQADPVIGLCVPEMDYPGEDRRLDYMFWVKLPFAEDEHNFWFPSLTTYKTASGKVVTEHPLLPTEEQCDLMDELVDALDLDEYASKEQAEKKKAREAELDDEEMEEDPDDGEPARWFDVNRSYNPVIHRIKEAIFHASLTQDLDAEPLGPPHPELTKYFNTPEALVKGAEDVTARLKEALKVKKVPPRQRKKAEKEELRPDEGYIDIDELFAGGSDKGKGKAKAEPFSPHKAKLKPASPDGRRAGSEESDILPPPTTSKPAKPKHGRLISNQQPLEDFNRLIEGEGDVFRKAIQDLGAVIKENVEGSFSKQAFPLAVECIKAMRQTALTYEEVELYNEYVQDLEDYIKQPSFKHRDFWPYLENEAPDVGKITPEEAKAALEAYDE